MDGNLPEDNLDWKVDEDRVKKYEDQFGPQAILFSETELSPDAIHEMGITREQWKEKFKQTFPNGNRYKPDPIILLAIARDFWRKYPDCVVAHLPTGEKRVICWEHLQKLREVEKLFAEGKITKEEYDSRAREILSTGKEDAKQKLKRQLKDLNELFDEGLITEAEYNSKKTELLSKL